MGKIKFVEGKNKHQTNCICIHNIDLTSGGCPIGLDSNGNFKKDEACTYCYARYLHKDFVKEKEVDEKEWIKLSQNLKVNVVRIGKNLEPGHIAHRDTLLKVLELNNKYKFKSILITKLLEFDDKVADLLKVLESTVHFSMGRESMESGAVARGSTNPWRLETAKKYFDYGVNTYLRVVEDITIGMRTEVKQWEASSIPLLITPLRYPSKETLKQYRPLDDWDILKTSPSFEYKDGFLKPIIWHSDYKPHKERCGVVKNIQHCNNCGLRSIRHEQE